MVEAALTFEEFAAARLPAVLRFAAVLTGDRSLAEDVVQEVLLRASRRWESIAGLDRPEAYPQNGRQRVPVLAPPVMALRAVRGRH